MTFTDADALHEVASAATATRETVASPVTKQLSEFIRELSRFVEEFDEDSRWVAFLRSCRRTLRDVITTPIAPNRSSLDIGRTIGPLENLLNPLRGSYSPQAIECAEYCILSIGEIALDDRNPLGDRVCEILETGNSRHSGVLVLTRHFDATKSWLANKSSGTRLLTTTELSGVGRLETLVVVGPSCWFPSFVLSSPRAESLAVVHFDWLRDHPVERNLLAGGHSQVGVEVGVAYRTAALSRDDDDRFDAELLLPKIDWDQLAAYAGSARPHVGGSQFVEARLHLLSGGFCVYLEAIDGASIDSVDFEGGGEPTLRREPTKDVSKGDYLVLRSSGGSGDYIADFADADLGRKAKQLRELQREWKQKLREKVEANGVARVERELQGMGVTSPNVRYRLLRQSIRSQKPEDFRILMQYIGLGARWETLWAAMEEIQRAHGRAGQRARNLLEAAALDCDLAELIRRGHIEVSLTEIDVGALGIYRVEDCSPVTQQVDEDDVRVLTRLEDDAWHE